jgi:phosphate transport system substrate-binding protein
MAFRRILRVFAIAALLAISASCSRSGPSRPKIEAPPGGVLLRGAGATFPAPLYEEWFLAYRKGQPKTAVAYDAVGSGAGIKRFIGKSTELAEKDLVDFGASDAAMTDAEIAEVDRGVRLVPMTAGAVVLAYNLPELREDLKLTREAYSGIFLGEITRWNDPKIVAANPGLEKAAMTIALVARQDPSGTTYALTNHLSAVSRKWRDRFGAVQLVDWPGAAMRVAGNEGVAGRIGQSLGSIGYVELGFARRLGLKTARLENKAGRFIPATAQSGRAALGSVQLPPNLRLFTPDPDGPDSYPITTLTWVLLYKDYGDAKKSAAVRDLFRWCLTEGQEMGEQLGYLRLSSNIVAPALAAVESVGPK